MVTNLKDMVGGIANYVENECDEWLKDSGTTIDELKKKYAGSSLEWKYAKAVEENELMFFIADGEEMVGAPMAVFVLNDMKKDEFEESLISVQIVFNYIGTLLGNINLINQSNITMLNQYVQLISDKEYSK